MAWSLYKEQLPRIVTWDENILYDIRPEARFDSKLLNWLQDLAMLIQNAAHESKNDAHRFIQFVHERLEAYPRCDVSTKEGMKRDVSELCFLLGMPEERKKRFSDLVKEFPSSAWVWIGWADMHSIFRNKESAPLIMRGPKGTILRC